MGSPTHCFRLSVPAGQHARPRGREVDLPVALHRGDAVGICVRVSWKLLARDPEVVMQQVEVSVIWTRTVENVNHDTRRACVPPSGLPVAAAGYLYISSYCQIRRVKCQINTAFASISLGQLSIIVVDHCSHQYDTRRVVRAASGRPRTAKGDELSTKLE